MRIFLCALMMGCSSNSSVPPDFAVSDMAMPVVPKAKIAYTSDVVGFVTRLDGSGSTDAQTYAWHFAQVPSGSALTDAALSTTSGPTPTFDPDVGGIYVVQLTVSGPDGSDTTMANVNVPTQAVFYHEAVIGPTSSYAVGVVRSDGSGARRISCAVTSSGSDLGGDDLFDLLEFPGLLSMRVLDGSPAHLAYEEVTPMIAAGKRTLQHSLWIADEFSDCMMAPPTRIDDGTLPGVAKLGPRFSPDGARVAYLEGSRLVTVALDGSLPHVVVNTPALQAVPPVWIDNMHLMWVEDPSPSPSPHPMFMSGEDETGTAPAVDLDCPPGGGNLAVVNQFERLSDDTLLVAGGTKRRADGGAISLYRMGVTCAVSAATLLVTPGVSGDAWDFAVSPDETTVALSSSVVQAAAPAPQHDLYIAKVDGSSLTMFGGSDALLDDVGPRWLAGGRQISWTQAARPDDAGLSNGAGVLIANLNGTHLRSLKSESGSVVVAPSNRGLSCDIGAGELPSLALLLWVAAVWRLRGDRRRT
jgi:hypothetical protein